MTCKLVAFDVDGTIVGPDFVLGDEIVEVVGELRSAGVAVTLATGRIRRRTLPYAVELAIRGPVVCYQGAMVFEAPSGEVIRHVGLEAEAARDALGRLNGFPGQTVLYLDDQIYSETRTAWSDGYERRMGLELNVVDSLAEIADRDPTLILATDSPENVESLVARLRREMDGRALITHSLPHFCEIASPLAGKVAALELVAESYGVTRDEVVAFGDGAGDVEMLEWAGLGVAMADGHAAAIAAANRVVEGPPGTGVARVLREMLDSGEFSAST